jgi:phosphonopyruvate decarboxylase
MQKGTCEPYQLRARSAVRAAARATIHGQGHARTAIDRPARREVLSALLDCCDPAETVVIATTGYTGRELYALDDRPSHFYMVGSMGCASSLGFGLARVRPDLTVVVVDGDGAALMRMGNLATIGAYRPANLIHLVLDNEAHDSTGAQSTVSAATDFAGIAAATGYAQVWSTDEVGDIAAIVGGHRGGGPTFAHIKTRTGTIENLPRPSITPPEVRARLMAHIDKGSSRQ